MQPAVNDGRALQRLLDELGRLPGIGPKSAQRIAYHLLEADAEEARRLAAAILEVKQQVHFCPVCFSYATRDTCDVCADWLARALADPALSPSRVTSRQLSARAATMASITFWAA